MEYYCHKMEWGTDTHYSMDEPWKHTKRKEAKHKEPPRTLWFLLYEMSRKGIVIEKERRLLVARVWEVAGFFFFKLQTRKWWLKGTGFLFWADENVLWLDSGDGCTICKKPLSCVLYNIFKIWEELTHIVRLFSSVQHSASIFLYVMLYSPQV